MPQDYWNLPNQDEITPGSKVFRDVKMLVDRTWVDEKTGGGQDAVNLTHRSINVTGVYEVDNSRLGFMYQREKFKLQGKADAEPYGKLLPYHKSKDIGHIKTKGIYITGHKLNKDINEVYLFHGSRAENINSIATEGFRLDKAQRGLYGTGVYLAESSQKADQYAGMFHFTNFKEVCNTIILN